MWSSQPSPPAFKSCRGTRTSELWGRRCSGPPSARRGNRAGGGRGRRGRTGSSSSAAACLCNNKASPTCTALLPAVSQWPCSRSTPLSGCQVRPGGRRRRPRGSGAQPAASRLRGACVQAPLRTWHAEHPNLAGRWCRGAVCALQAGGSASGGPGPEGGAGAAGAHRASHLQVGPVGHTNTDPRRCCSGRAQLQGPQPAGLQRAAVAAWQAGPLWCTGRPLRAQAAGARLIPPPMARLQGGAP